MQFLFLLDSCDVCHARIFLGKFHSSFYYYFFDCVCCEFNSFPFVFHPLLTRLWQVFFFFFLTFFFFLLLILILFCVAIHAALAACKLLYRSTARSILGFSNSTPAPSSVPVLLVSFHPATSSILLLPFPCYHPSRLPLNT